MKRALAVIGHTGRMGAMLMRRFEEAGHTVRGVDVALSREVTTHNTQPDTKTGARAEAADLPQASARRDAAPAFVPEELSHAVRDAELVLLCVPAQAVAATMDALSPYLAAHQILADICSVKVSPMCDMEARHPGPVVGTHPLFGPNPAPEDMMVAITPGARADEEHVDLVEDLFQSFGCRCFRTSPEKHDKGAALVQGLNFISSAAYFAALARQDIEPFLTPSFRRRLVAARKLLTEDAAMFQNIVAANPFTGEALQAFSECLDMAARGELPQVVRRASWWFEG